MTYPLPIPPTGGDKVPFTGFGDFGGGDNKPLSFSVRHLNWLAHLFGNTQFAQSLTPTREVNDTVRQYLNNLQLLPSKSHHDAATQTLITLETRQLWDEPYSVLLASKFADFPWRLLFFPGGASHHAETQWRFIHSSTVPPSRDAQAEQEVLRGGPEDRSLTSADLYKIVFQRSTKHFPGLIFQLTHVADSLTYLEDAFPAFQTAFSAANDWPGVVIWRQGLEHESVFLPLATERDVPALKAKTRRISNFNSRLLHIISLIRSDESLFPQQLKTQIDNRPRRKQAALPPAERDPGSKRLVIIHTSDMHLGDSRSNSRLIAIKNRIQGFVEEFRGDQIILPVVTGDLMDTPNEAHLDGVLDYMHFLDRLGTKRPVIVPGNHDVRKLGVLGGKYEEAMRLYIRLVVWLDECRVGILCFNSVRSGSLARGFIDEREFSALGHELDIEPVRSREYTLLALVHHHPCPVDIPDWYARKWYERWMGQSFDKTEELINAQTFIEWLVQRNVVAVLHGHKHIPRVTKVNGVTVMGCGSTTGKIDHVAGDMGRTYMSASIVTLNAAEGRMSCRLRAEQIVGAGMRELEVHEVLYREAIVKAA